MSNNAEQNPESDTAINNELFVVGIGASAGGLSALEELFNNLSSKSGAAFVVIQHLSPDFKSLMKELLERRTSMPVHRVTEGMELQPDSVYLIPPGQNLALEKNVLRLENRRKDKNQKHELNFPIDLFFMSLANNYGERSIGVILSGSGSDGSRGLKAVNEAGGIALVQDPKTAEFDGMPVSAIATGVVNQILPPRELSQLIYQCLATPANIFEVQLTKDRSINSNNLNLIAKILLEEEGLDFSQYKSSTVSRRIHRRCLIHSKASINDYIKLLNDSSDERQILCSDLLINVTHFFRDYPAWQNLENNILPRLIEQSKAEAELRLWITACSTGEEAYSLAILVHEALQDAGKNIRVKIFATDIDRVALDKASHGIYPASIATDVGPERLQQYFVAKDNSYQVMRKIREMLIFSPHDLTKDAGFTRINLVTCRNVLIYMQPDLQYQILRNLHFSLVSKGILFLGEAETLGEFESEFEPLNKKWKFFQKRRDIRLPLPLRSTPRIGKSSSFRFSQTQPRVKLEPVLEQSLERLADESDSVLLNISKDYNLLHVSGDSNKIFKPLGGKITTEVIKMVVYPLQLPLNTALHRSKQKETSVLYQGIKLENQGEILDVSLEVIPPKSNRQHGDFFLVRIKQKLATKPLKISEVENFELGSEAPRQILELENELQQTRENLQALVEELETTNEEQQASNEELTASNEELQSTNEELHSVNEELHTVNIEYQSKIGELTQLNDDVDNLLQSTEIGVIFLDSELRIRKFTPAVTTAISLKQSDLDRPLEDLNWKFECSDLLDLLHEVLVTKQSKELEIKLKNLDNYLLMQIHLYQTENQDNEGLVVSFIKIDEIKQAQQVLEREIIARKCSEEQLRINQEALQQTNLNLERRVADRTQSLAQFSSGLQLLHQLATKEYQHLETLFGDYLQVGCRMLGLSTGIVSEVNDCLYKIVAVESPLDLEVQYKTDCTNTYCAEVVETKTTISFVEVGNIESMKSHPVYLNFQLESFIGTPIFVKGSLYGTLSFSDTTPKASEFTPEEIKIVELMARDIGNSIASTQITAALEQANQAKDKFIAHVSHELRTPLTSILGFSKLLQQESQLTAQRSDYARIIHQSGQHLLELINDILDFSKITANQLELTEQEFDFILFLNQIVTNLSIRAEDRGLKLIALFSPNLPLNVRGDSNRLRQVLYNLLSNAIKFTESGTITFKVGYVKIDRAKRNEESEDLEISRSKICFEIEDTGIGISPDQFANIFIPFKQIDNRITDTKGTGLGLSISQNILQLMDSEIKLVSQIDRGSKFWFDLELPVLESTPLTNLDNSLDFDWQISRCLKVPHKVLVVDDHQENRILLINLLQPLGFIVQEANNGESGMALAKTFQPDIILTDLVMPIMNGKEMIANIKQNSQLKTIPIFTMSANNEYILQSSEVNCDEFIAKPINLEKLLKLLGDYLQLDWQLEKTTKEEDSSDFDVPSQEQLQHLLELADFGDIEAIEEQLDALISISDRYTIFASKIKQLTVSLQQEQLENFIANLIEK